MSNIINKQYINNNGCDLEETKLLLDHSNGKYYVVIKTLHLDMYN